MTREIERWINKIMVGRMERWVNEKMIGEIGGNM